MAWRVASSLVQMRDQLNTLFPDRSKTSDGTIGDSAHQASTSDHNPWVKDGSMGVVTAFDFTHDPGSGVNSHELAELLRQHKDPRIKYVISAGRIFSSVSSPWTWRKYTGSNSHHGHCHVSVLSTKSHYDSTNAWRLIPAGWKPTLRQGDRGVFVQRMQGHLGLTKDGVFGPGVAGRLRQFQTAHGLTADAVCGPLTWKELEKEKEPETPTPIPPEIVPPEPEVPIDPDAPGNRPVLRLGSKGEEVRIVQGLLTLRRDGDFGPVTDAAVRGFQRGRDIAPDGVVGPATWAELDTLEQLEVDLWISNIKCSVFGGAKDPNKSAYAPFDNITDEELSCALPWKFAGDRPQVEVVNRANGKRVIVQIRDLGPWLTDDDYAKTSARPIAETCFNNKTPLPRGPHKGKIGNGAGIDLTPAAAKAIGLVGMGFVDWSFVNTLDEGGPST